MTPLEKAREGAGLSPQAAAKRLRVSVKYLRSIELGSVHAPYPLAERAAQLYGVPLLLFTVKGAKGQKSKKSKTRKGKQAIE